MGECCDVESDMYPVRDQQRIAKYRGAESDGETKRAPWRTVSVAKPERETADAEECQQLGYQHSSPDAKQANDG